MKRPAGNIVNKQPFTITKTKEALELFTARFNELENGISRLPGDTSISAHHLTDPSWHSREGTPGRCVPVNGPDNATRTIVVFIDGGSIEVTVEGTSSDITISCNAHNVVHEMLESIRSKAPDEILEYILGTDSIENNIGEVVKVFMEFIGSVA